MSRACWAKWGVGAWVSCMAEWLCIGTSMLALEWHHSLNCGRAPSGTFLDCQHIMQGAYKPCSAQHCRGSQSASLYTLLKRVWYMFDTCILSTVVQPLYGPFCVLYGMPIVYTSFSHRTELGYCQDTANSQKIYSCVSWVLQLGLPFTTSRYICIKTQLHPGVSTITLM